MAKWRNCVIPQEGNRTFSSFLRKAHIPFEAFLSAGYICISYLATDGQMAKVNRFLESCG